MKKSFDIQNGEIIAEIVEELQRQQHLKIGGDTEEFDKGNTANDWVAYITRYLGKATLETRDQSITEDFDSYMVKVAALAVSAIRARRRGYLEHQK